jgi:hypothetical protein
MWSNLTTLDSVDYKKKQKLDIENAIISITKIEKEDYICLNDMAKAKEGENRAEFFSTCKGSFLRRVCHSGWPVDRKQPDRSLDFQECSDQKTWFL